MTDKKDLSMKCEHYSQKLLEKENEFTKYKVWTQEKIQEINKDSKNNSKVSIAERKINCKNYNMIFLYNKNKR